MKKVILLLLLFVTVIVNAQNSYTDLPGRWRLGFNMGGIWESSDVKPIPGLGGGFTIEKILNKRSNAFLGFSLGLRYLGGRTYGVNGSPTFDLANNKALNGTFSPAVNYDSTPGYFYANHKTFIQEGALELKMNFPSLEKRTGIIFHVWGGIGIGKYKTWIDALDKDGKMYDFSGLKGQPVTQSDLSRIYDGKYETLAQGSGINGTFAVIPSLGVGLGYKVSKHVAFVLEHKVSFPGTNWLDGIEYPKNCPVTGSKDFYNYTSVGIVFTFYGHHSTSGSTTNTNNTTGGNTTTSTTNTTTNYTPPPPVVSPPKVVITYPANNYASPYDYTTVNASLQNVTSSQNINISQNGQAINHFTYNASNGTLHFQTFLASGANNFVIVASNQGGTASQGVTINYTPAPVAANNGYTTVNTLTVVTTNTVTPTHTISPTFTTVTSATVSPTHTVAPTHTVSPTFTTVTSATVSPTHTVAPTNTVVSTFTTVTSATVSPTHTVTPTNTVSPSFTTASSGTVSSTFTTSTTGTVSSSDNTIHGHPTALKPIVSFIDPANYSTETTAITYNIIASVLNVSGSSQISVTVNGVNITQFAYSTSNKQVSFTTNLQLGYNTITISGTNAGGTDSKSVIINHKADGRPPKVSITNPASSPFTTLQNNIVVSGYVYNVASSLNITATANGAPTTFNYNVSNHEITVPLYLQDGNTEINISATNAYGNDAKDMNLIYKKVVADSTSGTITLNTGTVSTGGGGSTGSGMGGMGGSHTKPGITVLSPAVDPFYTNTGVISVSANINYVILASNVTVTYNSLQVSVTYDLNSKQLNFSSPLKPGLNTFIINATNQYGTASKMVNINYSPIIVNTSSGGSDNPSPTINKGIWQLGGSTTPAPSGDQNTVPTKVITNGGQTTPVKPSINSGAIQNPPKAPVTNDTAPSKPAENGGQQIKLRPR